MRLGVSRKGSSFHPEKVPVEVLRWGLGVGLRGRFPLRYRISQEMTFFGENLLLLLWWLVGVAFPVKCQAIWFIIQEESIKQQGECYYIYIQSISHESHP